MSDPHATDQRLTELEIKASYTEDLLDQMNLALYRQQQQIDRLVQELTHLRQQMPRARWRRAAQPARRDSAALLENIPLRRCAPSPFSGIAARCGRGTPPARRGGPCAVAAGLGAYPLHGPRIVQSPWIAA
jgi:SlyX protein